MKKFILAALSVFICLVCILISSIGGSGRDGISVVNIKSVTFSRDSDLHLDPSSGLTEAIGYIQVTYEGDNLTEEDILLISEDESIATIEIDRIASNLIRYRITAKGQGATSVYAASSDLSVKSESLSVTVSGLLKPVTETASTPSATSHETTFAQSEETTACKTTESEIPSIETNATTDEPYIPPSTESFTVTETPEQQSESEPFAEVYYVLNTNSKKIHYPTCSSVKQMSKKNYATTFDLDTALADGYEWCKRCG